MGAESRDVEPKVIPLTAALDASSQLPTPDLILILCLGSRMLAPEFLYGKYPGATNLVGMRN